MIFSNLGNNKYLVLLKELFTSNIIMNWSNVHKCILILILTLAWHSTWIVWKAFILINPNLWKWVNLPLVQSQVYVNSCSAIFLLFLTFFCYFFRNRDWANTVLPHFILNLFIVLLLVDGFLIGIYSPATIFAFVCISGLGLVLFNRTIVYTQLIIALIIFFILMFCTYTKAIPYAPIFSSHLVIEDPHLNPFWIMSMLFFTIPLLLTCLILFEILLSQWRYRESLIESLSQTDPLTNLYNRRFFNETIDHIEQLESQYAIILVDIDHFKKINDQYGHHLGDEALKKVATLLSSQIRQSDIIARYGGEEFIIAMPNTALIIAQDVAERCRLIIQNTHLKTLEYPHIELTASFGVAVSVYGHNINKVIQLADQALYRAKQLGRNQVQLYTDLEKKPK